MGIKVVTEGLQPTLPPSSVAALVGGEGGRLDQLQFDVRKGSVVNVNPTNTRAHSETPEIRKYKKRFNSEILCAALWGKLGPKKVKVIWAQLPCFWSGRAWICPDLSKGSSCRGQPPSGHREWADVAGPKRAGQSVRTYWAAPLPANGCPGRAQLAHHHLRCVCAVGDKGLNVCLLIFILGGQQWSDSMVGSSNRAFDKNESVCPCMLV